MQSSTTGDSSLIEALARESGFPADAIASMVGSIRAGGGRMAQFDHPAFGGAGQWMPGGMLMIGDFSDDDLRRRVGLLCDAISQRLGEAKASDQTPGSVGGSLGRTRTAWWPANLGNPDTSGAQNDMRYAWFSQPARLAIDVGGQVTVYDTSDHRIGGVSQQQGGRRTLAFTSQHGLVDLARLRVVEGRGEGVGEGVGNEQSTASETDRGEALPPAREESPTKDDAYGALEKLASLHARGILSSDEFSTKKAELLARI